MRALFFLLCLLPLGMTGQDLSKYLEGAVPVVDGKVVFTREVSVPGLSGEAIFARVTEMVATRFKVAENTWGRLLYSNADEGVIICWGREYLVFTQKALVLDRTLVDYQVLYTCKPGACSMEISRIRYQYGEDTKTQYLAEEWITDEHAYNKKRGRLLHGSDKFRMKTIDLVDDLEKLTREALQVPGDRDATPRVIPPREELPTPAAIPATREGYQRILPTEINGNFINMLINGSLTLSGATGKPGVTTRWGGIGYLFDRPVVYCFAPRAGEDDRPGENYTLLWTPAGQGQSLYREVLFECRALLAQPLALDAAAGWGDKPLPYFYTGEIIAIWVK